jgi:signal transduction histidine kinase
LADREDLLERNSRLEEVVQFSSFGLIALTCTLAFLRLSKELQKVSALVDKLEVANETLEEKVLMRTQQLSEANASKDHFLGIASHDLKAPIAGMQGIIQLMRLEKKDRDDNEISYLNYMEDACKAMITLITNLLDISRIDRGEMVFQKEAVAVKDVLARIERLFRTQANKKDIPLEVSGDDVVVYTDPGNLGRILENLVSNALKFSTHGQPVRLHASQKDHHITFTVADHGPGILPEEMPLLFQKFSHLSNRPTGGEGSTGLGLAIVKELTELAGGSLTVDSTVGTGSIFSVHLPVQ